MTDTTIVLDYPIKNGNEEVRELNLRRLIIGDLQDIDINTADMKDVIKLASKLSSLPPSVIAKIDISDFGKVKEVIANFLRPFQ